MISGQNASPELTLLGKGQFKQFYLGLLIVEQCQHRFGENV